MRSHAKFPSLGFFRAGVAAQRTIRLRPRLTDAQCRNRRNLRAETGHLSCRPARKSKIGSVAKTLSIGDRASRPSFICVLQALAFRSAFDEIRQRMHDITKIGAGRAVQTPRLRPAKPDRPVSGPSDRLHAALHEVRLAEN